MEDKVAVCPACGARNRLSGSSAIRVPVCGKCGSRLPWLTTAGEATFAEEIKAPVPVLVDFWAEWCGPCRMVGPVLEELSRDLAGRLKVVKVNVDQNPAVAQRFRVMSIPTMILFRDGRQVDTMVGALPKGALLDRLQPYLPS